jgi:hypothetical protein
MEMQKPTDEHRRLEAMAGRWTGEETIYPSPWSDGGSATGSYENRIDLDGWALVADYVQRTDGEVRYRGHGVFGFDAERNRYLMYWSDNMAGMPTEAVPGVWEDYALVFQHASSMGHVRYTYLFPETGEFTFALENSQDGASWTPFVTGQYHRND